MDDQPPQPSHPSSPPRRRSEPAPLPAAPPPTTALGPAAAAPASSVGVAPSPAGFGAAWGYLFRQPAALERLWVLPLIALIPLLNVIFLRGWRADVARHVARGEHPVLPPISRIPIHLIHGLFLWAMTILFALPHLIVTAVHFVEFAAIAREAADGGDWLTPENVARVGFALALSAGMSIVLWPLARIGYLRFVATGSPLAYLMVPQNLFAVLRHAGTLLMLFLKLFVTYLLFGALSFLLGLTGVGVFLVLLVVLPFSFAVTGHLYGQAAGKIGRIRGWLPSP